MCIVGTLFLMEETNVKEITVEELLQIENVIPIDIRAPIEFKDGAIPEAINIPLFTDEERAEIGTIYKQSGQKAAKWRAMEVVSPKLPTMLSKIRALTKDGKQPVIYCWRGGMRSRSVVTFLEYAGVSSIRLIDGYRGYRHYILEQIPKLMPEKAVVLHGMTGVGKTDILHILKNQGFPIIDLEGIAAHRGSVFGGFGIGEGSGNNQKTFDALLFEALRNLNGSQYMIIEAESKRIGRAVLPAELLELKENGLHLHINASLETRVERIYKEYVSNYENKPWFHEKVVEGIRQIQKRIKDDDILEQLNLAVHAKNYRKVIHYLLAYYYDSRYEHKDADYVGPFVTINSDHLENTISDITNYLESFSLKATLSV